MDDQLTLMFEPLQNADKLYKQLSDEFPECSTGKLAAFTGVETVSIVIPGSLILLRRLLKFYLQWRENLSDTRIFINKEGVELSGFTKEEIEELLASKTIQDLIKKIHGKSRKK